MKVGRPKGVVKPASASERDGEEAADDDEVSMISNLIDDSSTGARSFGHATGSVVDETPNQSGFDEDHGSFSPLRPPPSERRASTPPASDAFVTSDST